MNEEVELNKTEKEFKALKRRMKTTRQSRIEASKRLRKNHSYFEKIIHFYSLIILILSVWFLNQSGEEGVFATKILLVLSLSLTYFTMFLNLRNYKERAGDFETNYQHLDVLNNKFDRFESSDEQLDAEKLKEFQREYERLIIGKENHLNIDYYVSTEDNRKKFKKEVWVYRIKEGLIKSVLAIYPIVLLIIIYFFDKVISKIHF
ncbi:SLATT domain-containing protein [Rossellomorea sp. y25]|uniref:SLATT domain-containing protein n=1 Tax=Rossellomorea sp. y25 TaxID=3118174 RepID=UPI0030E35813